MANENNEKDKQNTEDPTKNLSVIEEAKKIKEELKAENDRRELILKQEQKLQAEKLLSSSAGTNIPPAPPKQETDKEYAERISREIREGKYNGAK